MNRDDIRKLALLYESMKAPEPMGPKCTIAQLIAALELWVKMFNDEDIELKRKTAETINDFEEDRWPANHQILKDYLSYAKLSVNQPKRRKPLFDAINKKVRSLIADTRPDGGLATDSFPSGAHFLLNYILPNFGEVDGEPWEKYEVVYPDGDVYTIDLHPIDWEWEKERREKGFGDYWDSELDTEKPEEMGNVCNIDEIIENLEYWVSQDDDKYFKDALKLAKRSQTNPSARDELIRDIEADPAYIIPNFGEVEGMYSTYTIRFPDGDKREVRI
jgi:hypothetical protein